MKKIININLSGRVIPIEDSAYESLQRYVESLRRYFAAEEGRDEIINDIESRIAELMNDKIRKGSAAVTDADIEEIINSMGRVEDFEEAEAADTTAAGEQASGSYAYTQTAKQRFKGRLYRDASDKMIGGVCAGLANYMNIDPAIVRLLFAIVTFGGFGMGIFIYILLWIILPSRDLDTYIGKRLFRNPDDRVIGGVAGGLAAYFNKQPWTIRLIFAAPLLINIFFSILNGVFSPWDFHFRPLDLAFGSLTGTFIVTYIILWIVLPEARSTFEKMEMRGEKVDVNRIRQNVQEGMSDFKTRAHAWGEEVKTSAENLGQRAKEWADTRGKTFAAEAAQAARPVANGLGHIIGVLFKAFFLFIAGTIAFALFVVVLVFIMSGIAQPFRDFLLNGFWQQVSFAGILIFFLAVPLIAIITWIVRRVMKVRSQNRYLGWVFGGLWALGWVSLFLFIASMGRDWRYYNRVSQPLNIAQPATGKLTVRIDEPEIRYSGTFDWIDADDEGFDLTEDSLLMANVKLRVDKSNDSLYRVTIWRYSAGENRREAQQRAERIVYFASSLDSTLLLGSGLGIGKAQKFRGQKVMVEIKVPVGKRIMFDESVEGKLHPINIRVSEGRRWNRNDWDMDWDDDSYFDWKSNTDYVMTASGDLEEVGNRTDTITNPTGVYEYRPQANTPEADSIRRIMEERQRQQRADSLRLRELEQRSSLQRRDAQEGTARAEFPMLSIII
jgi:phage shock protein PspC (stress-responsive transcriptional regulator)